MKILKRIMKLYYRNTNSIRKEKINKQLHKNVNKIPFEVMEILQNHEWIGNVRELENTLIQALVLNRGNILEKENLLFRLTNHNKKKYLICLF